MVDWKQADGTILLMFWPDMAGTIDSIVEDIPTVTYGTGRRVVPFRHDENYICYTNTLIAPKSYLREVYMRRQTY